MASVSWAGPWYRLLVKNLLFQTSTAALNLSESSANCLWNALPPRPSSNIRVSMKRIAILGSTGSIGRSTLSVVESFPDRFQVVTLAAGRNVDLAFEQAQRWRPQIVSVAAESQAENLKVRLRSAGVAGG